MRNYVFIIGYLASKSKLWKTKSNLFAINFKLVTKDNMTFMCMAFQEFAKKIFITEKNSKLALEGSFISRADGSVTILCSKVIIYTAQEKIEVNPNIKDDILEQTFFKEEQLEKEQKENYERKRKQKND